MKTICMKPGRYEIVDNERDYDYVGYIDNFTNLTLVVTFVTGEVSYDEETAEMLWCEDDWSVDQLVFADGEGMIEKIDEYARINALEMITIDPRNWGGFLADNKGRAMFNALRKAYSK